MKEKPWSVTSYLDNLPDYHLRPTAPPVVDLPLWVEPALVACILGIAVVVLLLAILPSLFAAHPGMS